MPRLRKPESAIDRLVFMKKAVETDQTSKQQGESYISQATIDRVTQFIPGFETGMGEIGSVQSLSQKEIREKNLAQTVLKTYMKDVWEVLRRKVYRENLPLDVFAFYQLPKNGNNPVLTSEGQWLETAALVIKGEADAIKAGYTAMANPSIAELNDKLNIAIAEAKDVSDADKQLDKAQEAVSDLMPEAKNIIDRIIAELNFNLYEKDDAGKRRIMRNYGVRYELTKNEEAEDETDISKA